MTRAHIKGWSCLILKLIESGKGSKEYGSVLEWEEIRLEA